MAPPYPQRILEDPKRRPEIMDNVKVYESACAQLCPTLGNSMDCRLHGSSFHGIFQAKILAWAATSFSRGNFSTQESNPCLLHLLHWQANSLPLAPSGKHHG